MNKYNLKMKKNIYFILLITLFSNKTLNAQFFSSTEIYKKCVDAVVLISTPYGTGTGFFINEEGYVITNHHVIQDSWNRTLKPSSITVKTKKGGLFSVISVDDTPDFKGLDIAILKVKSKSNNYLSIKTDEALVGEDVVAIGHPNRDLWNQSKGIISKISLDDPYLLQHDVATDEGNSGGPLINAKGQVVGVVTAYKKMRDNDGYSKIQETGKLATKSIWVKSVLDKRKIKYYSSGIVIEGMTELDRQFNDLLKDRESLNNDREKLRIERANLENERIKLNQDIIAFEKKRQESLNIIEKAEIIKREIESSKNIVDKKLRELEDKESRIEDRERWLRNKESEINKKIAKRLAIEIMVLPNYLYNQNIDNHFIMPRGSVGLFFRFGFERDYYDEVKSSDKIGVIYGVQNIFNFSNNVFDKGYNQDLSLAIEFDEIFRLGIGRNIRNEYKYLDENDYNFAYIIINTTGYPFSFGFNLAFYTDNKFIMKNYCIGLFTGISLSFLRL